MLRILTSKAYTKYSEHFNIPFYCWLIFHDRISDNKIEFLFNELAFEHFNNYIMNLFEIYEILRMFLLWERFYAFIGIVI